MSQIEYEKPKPYSLIFELATVREIEYFARTHSISENDINTALELPKFRAAFGAYYLSYVVLGYAAYFCWGDIKKALPNIDPGKLLYLVHYGAMLGYLSRYNPESPEAKTIVKAVKIDPIEISLHNPEYFIPLQRVKWTERQKKLLQEMGVFAFDHPWKYWFISEVQLNLTKSYARYYIDTQFDRISFLLSNELFLALLDAYRTISINHERVVEVLNHDRNSRLLPDLNVNQSGHVLMQLSGMVDEGRIVIPNHSDLVAKYPDVFDANLSRD